MLFIFYFMWDCCTKTPSNERPTKQTSILEIWIDSLTREKWLWDFQNKSLYLGICQHALKCLKLFSSKQQSDAGQQFLQELLRLLHFTVAFMAKLSVCEIKLSISTFSQHHLKSGYLATTSQWPSLMCTVLRKNQNTEAWERLCVPAWTLLHLLYRNLLSGIFPVWIVGPVCSSFREALGVSCLWEAMNNFSGKFAGMHTGCFVNVAFCLRSCRN